MSQNIALRQRKQRHRHDTAQDTTGCDCARRSQPPPHADVNTYHDCPEQGEKDQCKRTHRKLLRFMLANAALPVLRTSAINSLAHRVHIAASAIRDSLPVYYQPADSV